jgi:hypothetical protein
MASSSVVNSGEHWAGLKGWRLAVQTAARMDDSQAAYWGESWVEQTARSMGPRKVDWKGGCLVECSVSNWAASTVLLKADYLGMHLAV